MQGELENPDVWNDPERAQRLGKERARLEGIVNTVVRLDDGLVEAHDLLELAGDEDDADTVSAVPTDLAGLEKHLRELERQVMGNRDMNLAQESRTELLRMPFRDHIPEEHWPLVLDWTYSNMSKLFDVGYQTGCAFVEDHKARLERSIGDGRTLKVPGDAAAAPV